MDVNMLENEGPEVGQNAPTIEPTAGNAATKEQEVKDKEAKDNEAKDKEAKEKEKGDKKKRKSSGMFDQMSAMLKAPYVTETEAWPTANPAVQEAVNYALQEQNRLKMNALDDLKKIMAASGSRTGGRGRSESIVVPSDDDDDGTTAPKTAKPMTEKEIKKIVDDNYREFFGPEIEAWVAASNFVPVQTKVPTARDHVKEFWPAIVESVKDYNDKVIHTAEREQNENPDLHVLTEVLAEIEKVAEGPLTAYCRTAKLYSDAVKAAASAKKVADDQQQKPAKANKTSANAVATDNRPASSERANSPGEGASGGGDTPTGPLPGSARGGRGGSVRGGSARGGNARGGSARGAKGKKAADT